MSERTSHRTPTSRRRTSARLRRSGRRAAVAVVAVLCAFFAQLATRAEAQQNPWPEGAMQKVDGRLAWLAALGQHERLALQPLLDDSSSDAGAAVTIRLRLEVDGASPDAVVSELRKFGVRPFHDDGGRLAVVGGVLSAWLPYDAIDAVASLPVVQWIEPSWRPVVVSALSETVDQIEATLVHRVPTPANGFRGEGTRVAIIDSAFDPHHPAFFRGDGAFHAWWDVDGDGVLRPGDAVDLDGDGQVDTSEQLSLLSGADEHAEDPQRFDPSRDWLFVDSDGDGRWDVGQRAGFDDRTPAFGEPIFFADDANGDGVVAGAERIVRLGSSRIGRMWINGRAFLAGRDLSEADAADLYVGSGAVAAVHHGTAVAGIVSSGIPMRQRACGVAPDAELSLYSATPSERGDTHVAAMSSVLREEATVLLHQRSSWVGEFLDGSSNVEVAANELHDAGIVQVAPAGNLGNASRHAQIALRAGQNELTVHVPEQGDDGEPIIAGYTSLLWPPSESPPDLSLAVTGPSGTIYEVSAPELDGLPVEGGQRLYAFGSVSPRGTHRLDLWLLPEDGEAALPAGDWIVGIDARTEHPQAHLFVADAYTGWAGGIRVAAPTSESTVAWPATADEAIVVGAVGGKWLRLDEGTGPGDVRRYSGRGPRIDGIPRLDVVAPDDPSAPATRFAFRDWHAGSYRQFGGTSGAAAHVAGVVALLAEAFPDATSDELVAHLRSSADVAGIESASRHRRGFGAARAGAGILGDIEPFVTNVAPSLRMTVEAIDGYVVIDLSESEDEDGDRLRYEFDVDYDGAADIGPSRVSELRIDLVEGEYAMRASVYDGRGGYAEAAARFVVDERGQLDSEVEDTPAPGGASPEGPVEGRGCAVSAPAPRPALPTALLVVLVATARCRRASPQRRA